MNLFWWRKPKPEPKSNKTVFIDGWRLLVNMNYGNQLKSYDHPELQNLWKIYGWYLTKDSEKYNIQSSTGYEIINRHDVVSMELRKIKLPKSDWVKENNDETETD